MTRHRLVAPLALVLALVVLSAIGVAVRPAAAPARTTAGESVAANAVTLVCPRVSGVAAHEQTVLTVTRGASAGTVTRTPLDGRSRPVTLTQPRGRYAVTGDVAMSVDAAGDVAATVAAEQTTTTLGGAYRGLADATCEPPRPDVWLVGADGRVNHADLLVLANPAPSPVTLSVTVWGDRGPLSAPGVATLTLAARTSRVLPVASFAPDAGPLAFHVHADTGAVAAAVLARSSVGGAARGVDWIVGAAAPSRRAVLTGLVAGNGARNIVLANPGSTDATVSLRVVGSTRSFVPSGAAAVRVPAGRTATVDLSPALAGDWAGVVATSDQPVAVSAESTSYTGALAAGTVADMSWEVARAPLSGTAVLPVTVADRAGHGYLTVTAPDAATTVSVTPTDGTPVRRVDVAAGRTAVVNLATLLHVGTADPGAVVLSAAGGPAYVSRTLVTPAARGPLVAAGPPLLLPPQVVLPAVLDDPAAAVR